MRLVQFILHEKKPTGRLTAQVKNGSLLLPAGLNLAEGTLVELIPLTALPSDPPFLRSILEMSKARDWPKDFALNHGSYAKGIPKK